MLFLSPYLKYPKENSRPGEVMESYEAIGIAPHSFSQNSLSLSVGKSTLPHTECFTLTQLMENVLISIFGVAVARPSYRQTNGMLGSRVAVVLYHKTDDVLAACVYHLMVPFKRDSREI